MQEFLRKIFRARPGEWGAVLLLQLLIFLIIAILLIVKPTASALFLNEYGAVGLPYMFVVTAFLAAVVSTGYAFALRYNSLIRVMIASLTILLVILGLCGWLMKYPSIRPAVSVALYLWVAIFGVLAASQFWMMASFVFDVRQSKRLFGLIGAGAIAGGIAGGYVTNLFVQDIGARNLMLLAALLLLPCILLTAFIWRRYVSRTRSKVSRKKKSAKEFKAPHRLILESKHLLLMCAIIALSVTVAKLVDYQFSALAAVRYGSQERLAAFFGFWYSTFNIIALLIQLLLTQRIVRLFGVSGALLFLPLGLGLGALVMLFLPGLGAATFSRATDGSLKQSLSRASSEMLFLPVDAETKKQVKTYIDVFIDSAAGGLGGLILILLTQIAGFSAASISWVVILFTVVWLVCVLMIREEYMDAFRDQLSHLQPREKRNRMKSTHKQVLAGFLQVLKDGKITSQERQLLYVLERSDSLADASLRTPVRRLLNHPSANVRARALRSLYLQPGADLVPEVSSMIKDDNPQVRAAAFDYLFSRPESSVRGILKECLEEESVVIAGPALVSLATETSGNEVSRDRWDVAQRLRARIRAMREMPTAQRREWAEFVLRACGRAQSVSARSFILSCLIDEDPVVAKHAVIAAGEYQHEEFIRPLLQLITEPSLRKQVEQALVQYGPGLTAVLPDLIRSGEISVQELRRLPAVLSQLDSRASVDLLIGCIERYAPNDYETRLQAIRGLNKIRRDFPNRVLPAKTIYRLLMEEAAEYESLQERLNVQNILLTITTNEEEMDYREGYANLLRQRMAGTFERLMRLLGLRYSPTDIIPVHRALTKGTVEEQMSAIEFLDNLLESSVKRSLIPLLEARQRQIAEATQPILPTRDSMEVLRRREFKSLKQSMEGRDRRLQLSALKLMGRLRNQDYLPLLKQYAVAEELSPRLRAVARESWRLLEGKEIER